MNTRNVLDWLEEAARLAPDGVALEEPGRRLTWSQVRLKARCVGSALCGRFPRQ